MDDSKIVRFDFGGNPYQESEDKRVKLKDTIYQMFEGESVATIIGLLHLIILDIANATKEDY